VHVRDAALREVGELLLDRGGVADRRRHQQELAVAQHEQRDLPRDPALAVVVEVELVEHHARRVGGLAAAQRHVREHLGGAADHRRARVDARVAGQHADAVGAELVAEREELLGDERLHRRAVERALARAQRAEVQRERDERLARAGRRREHDVAVREQLEDRLLLLG
jgi:hypothetical protein